MTLKLVWLCYHWLVWLGTIHHTLYDDWLPSLLFIVQYPATSGQAKTTSLDCETMLTVERGSVCPTTKI